MITIKAWTDNRVYIELTAVLAAIDRIVAPYFWEFEYETLVHTAKVEAVSALRAKRVDTATLVETLLPGTQFLGGSASGFETFDSLQPNVVITEDDTTYWTIESDNDAVLDAIARSFAVVPNV